MHFSAFHPDYKLTDLPPTPPSTLTRARRIARAAGLKHVYTGNVRDVEGGTTRCAACDEPLVVRDWFDVTAYRLDGEGRCPTCRAPLAGRFGAFDGAQGKRRVRLRVGA